METTPESKVSNWLKSPGARRGGGGPSCGTCKLDNIEEINRSLIAFDKAKKGGKTTVLWSRFVRLAIVGDPDYKYPLRWRALLRHAEDCCGFEIS